MPDEAKQSVDFAEALGNSWRRPLSYAAEGCRASWRFPVAFYLNSLVHDSTFYVDPTMTELDVHPISDFSHVSTWRRIGSILRAGNEGTWAKSSKPI
ncbi:hypothetical protein MESS4_610029 [Mesorhizobium sp. STM 4661]|nr:hypothetical protein MESS4_610029 [Mesorhizobium sp. STM 4661]